MSRKIKFLTDSGCDITRESEALYGIDIMPFSIIIDDTEYWERVDLSPQRFYELADASPNVPKTAQITAERFEQRFRFHAEGGVDDLIVVLINSTGSKTYENAVAAREKLMASGELGKMTVTVIDSRVYSLGYGYPVVEAAKKAALGQNAQQITAFLQDWFDCCEAHIVGFDLRQMKKSGRISAAAGFLGAVIGLKPIIYLIDGETVVEKKSRGEKAAIDDFCGILFQRMTPKTPWCLVRSNCAESEDAFSKKFTKMTGYSPAVISYSGCAVSANAGTKFIGVIIKGKKRR